MVGSSPTMTEERWADNGKGPLRAVDADADNRAKLCPTPRAVILGLEPRIQVADEAVDGRVKPDHDGGEVGDIAERAAVSAALFRYRYICLIVSSASISSRDPQTAICPRTSK
jgi:hypothetical protein